ncbi:hypothetical protein DSS3PM1_00022 [Bacteriophage DSS3_PM1]|nr:hypothetical protein DSS3PM1_00022 [Bacteriophage DSS3_PM1]
MQIYINSLFQRFTYTRDVKHPIDNWKYPKKGFDRVFGDCEDFSLQLLYDLAGQSNWRFWWYLISFQAVIWHVTSYNGNGHAVLWFRGKWADNMERTWYTTDKMRHTRRFPYLFPLVALKLIMARIVHGKS